ncbi:MAG: Asp23/Gls24 family envelope stress response protein [Anaerolineales bacterium]|nr:MAG: Asp23/Gls24 family envelope stress response protein [Anaerolineales bacterium]
MDKEHAINKITVEPEVIETIARLSALAVPGVARLISPTGLKRLLKQDGVKLEIVGNSVRLDLYVVTEADASMLTVGRQIQAEVTRAIQEMVGMEVESINIHIEDVAHRAKPKPKLKAKARAKAK